MSADGRPGQPRQARSDDARAGRVRASARHRCGVQVARARPAARARRGRGSWLGPGPADRPVPRCQLGRSRLTARNAAPTHQGRGGAGRASAHADAVLAATVGYRLPVAAVPRGYLLTRRTVVVVVPDIRVRRVDRVVRPHLHVLAPLPAAPGSGGDRARLGGPVQLGMSRSARQSDTSLA